MSESNLNLKLLKENLTKISVLVLKKSKLSVNNWSKNVLPLFFNSNRSRLDLRAKLQWRESHVRHYKEKTCH